MNNFGAKTGYVGNPLRARINHPLADEISYFEEPSATDCFEVAFFKGNDWVTEIVPELSLWAESYAGNTRVYRYIPKEVVYTFLVRFEVGLFLDRLEQLGEPPAP